MCRPTPESKHLGTSSHARGYTSKHRDAPLTLAVISHDAAWLKEGGVQLLTYLLTAATQITDT